MRIMTRIALVVFILGAGLAGVYQLTANHSEAVASDTRVAAGDKAGCGHADCTCGEKCDGKCSDKCKGHAEGKCDGKCSEDCKHRAEGKCSGKCSDQCKHHADEKAHKGCGHEEKCKGHGKCGGK